MDTTSKFKEFMTAYNPNISYNPPISQGSTGASGSNAKQGVPPRKLYYTPPTDKQFDELKQKAIMIWESYDNQFGYADEKVNQIKDIKNLDDNFMYMVAMFDFDNQRRLANMLTPETRHEVCIRMKDGGQPDSFNPFI